MPDLTVVILAAGPDHRMRAYSPKSLIGLPDGRTVVGRQIDICRTLWPGADVVVVAGYHADQVARKLPRDCRLVENERYLETGSARSALLGLRAATGPRCLLLMGDLVFDQSSLTPLKIRKSAVLVDPTPGGDRDPGVLVTDGVATSIGYGLTPRWAGAALLCGKELAKFKAAAVGADRERLMAFEILDLVAGQNGEFLAVSAGGPVVRIDAVEDLDRAKKVALA